MEILHRNDLPLGGFAGLKERRLVTNSKPDSNPSGKTAWSGIGNFVYLSDANFQPYGDTTLHDHKEVDVITFILEGRLDHEGSLAHGGQLKAPDIQVQRAGGEGFSHNEINPDDKENRILQLWVLPEKKGEPAGYQVFSPRLGEPLCIYGGNRSTGTYSSRTTITVALLEGGNKFVAQGGYMTYIANGSGNTGDKKVKEGDLLRGNDLEFYADKKTYLITVQFN